jgi:hypothetical protein
VSDALIIPSIELICSSCEQNSLSSDLLRLPPEVRMMIWSYALSGQTIKLAPKRRPLEMVVWSHDRFPLLRVCRQVYSEAAILPYTLNTFYFTILQHYLDYARSSLIKHVQHISMWRYSWERQGLHFPSTNARVLKTIEYAVFLVPEYMDDKDVVKKRLEDRNDGVSVTVRYLDLGTDW